MDLMDELPDKYIDLAVIDPPYGLGCENGTGDYSKKIVKKNKKWDKVPDEMFFTELFRISKNQIIWGGNYFYLPIKRGWICWYKTDEVKGRDFSEFELAFTSFDIPARHVSIKPFIHCGDRIHPTQKPIALYKWLLSKYAKPGWLILDTHVGSASSLIACEDLGFDYFACELDADYYRDSCKRIDEWRAQPKLEKIEQEFTQTEII